MSLSTSSPGPTRSMASQNTGSPTHRLCLRTLPWPPDRQGSDRGALQRLARGKLRTRGRRSGASSGRVRGQPQAVELEASLRALPAAGDAHGEVSGPVPGRDREQAAIIWKCIYGVLFTYLDSNAHWLVRKHEVLSSNPVAELRNLCKVLGLEWTKMVEDDVVNYTRSGNPVTAPEGTVHLIRRDSAAIVPLWKEILTKEEIAGVHRITRAVCDRLYTDEDWGD